ncbi:MAG: hypothetical protein K0Q72_3277, partial [Armatimonadetes bacterium]|nr:hypothetical protein [Armatimonadota bacterium]
DFHEGEAVAGFVEQVAHFRDLLLL